MTRYFIRGTRIANQLELILQEATYAELEQKTVQFTPITTKRQHAVDPLRVVSMELTPAKENGILVAKATVQSEGTKYTATISFAGVEYHNDDQAGNISFKGSGGDDDHITPINLREHDCKVSCDCLDFYWRFATQNAKVGSLDAKAPPPYSKRTNRPPANLKNTPGVCKHIMKVVVALRDAKLVR